MVISFTWARSVPRESRRPVPPEGSSPAGALRGPVGGAATSPRVLWAGPLLGWRIDVWRRQSDDDPRSCANVSPLECLAHNEPSVVTRAADHLTFSRRVCRGRTPAGPATRLQRPRRRRTLCGGGQGRHRTFSLRRSAGASVNKIISLSHRVERYSLSNGSPSGAQRGRLTCLSR